MKKLACGVSMIIAVMIFSSVASANQLPWLDFGNNLLWDGTTLTNDVNTQVTQVNYLNGSGATPTNPFPPSDPVLGVFSFIPPATFSFDNVYAKLSVSFDGNNANDWLKLESSDGSGIIWLDAQLDVLGSAADPLNSIVYIESAGLSVASGMGSQWADELVSMLNMTQLYPAVVSFSTHSSIMDDLGNGVYRLNGSGKVAVPEPGTLILLGSGLAGVAFYARRKKA